MENVVPIPTDATAFVVIAIPGPATISIGSSPLAFSVCCPSTYQGLKLLPRSIRTEPLPSSVTLNPLPIMLHSDISYQ